MSITLEDMSLYTVDEAREALNTGLTGEFLVPAGSGTFNTNGSEWGTLDDLSDDVPLDATLSVNGSEMPLSKRGLIDLASRFGMSRKYAESIPSTLMGTNINYWLKNFPDEVRFLRSDEALTALAKTTHLPLVRNSSVFDHAVNGLTAATGVSVNDIRVDYKLETDSKKSAFRLIQPTGERTISTMRHSQQQEDLWHFGLSVEHSEMGLSPTSMYGYTFAWWCTNGAYATHATSAKYDRRSHGMGEDEFAEWVQTIASDIVTDMPQILSEVAELTTVNLEGQMSDAAGSVFDRYNIHSSIRESVMNALVESDDWTAYGLMNAVTQAANGSDVSEADRRKVFVTGGDLHAAFASRCETCHRI